MVTDNRKQLLTELAAFCAGIIPTNVGNFPNERDGIELAKDLRLLAVKVDRVIAAYGDYAESCIGYVDKSLFVDVCSDAIDGNATFEIEQAARTYVEDNSQFGVGA